MPELSAPGDAVARFLVERGLAAMCVVADRRPIRLREPAT